MIEDIVECPITRKYMLTLGETYCAWEIKIDCKYQGKIKEVNSDGGREWRFECETRRDNRN